MVNDPKEIPSLNESVYSKKAFIEFIEKWLLSRGVFKNTYNFLPGKDTAIKETVVSESERSVTISFSKSTPPSVTLPSIDVEYGQSFEVGTEPIEITVYRNSYGLKEITWAQVTPPIALDKVALVGTIEGESKTINVSNGLLIDGDALLLASGGTYSDNQGQGGILEVPINRKSRHFYHVDLSKDGAINDDILDDYSSTLGDLPETVTVDHGHIPTYFVFASPDSVSIQANGIEVPITKFENNLNCYQADLLYNRPYNVYVTNTKITGEFTYQIKKI